MCPGPPPISSPPIPSPGEEIKENKRNKGNKGRHPPWKPGQSGNPLGKPKGAKNKSTLITQRIQEALLKDLQGEAESILSVALEKARGGDRVLLKFFLERFLPAASSGADVLDPSNGKIQIIITPMIPPPPPINVINTEVDEVEVDEVDEIEVDKIEVEQTND